eukprot:1149803-Pelagomonas_calceolata.AAC.4
MSVFFAHWAPAKLAARILCQPSGMPLNIVLSLLFFLGGSLKLPEMLPARDTLNDMSHWATPVSGVFGGKGHGVKMGCVCVILGVRWSLGFLCPSYPRLVGSGWSPPRGLGGVAVGPGASVYGNVTGMCPVE